MAAPRRKALITILENMHDARDAAYHDARLHPDDDGAQTRYQITSDLLSPLISQLNNELDR